MLVSDININHFAKKVLTHFDVHEMDKEGDWIFEISKVKMCLNCLGYYSKHLFILGTDMDSSHIYEHSFWRKGVEYRFNHIPDTFEFSMKFITMFGFDTKSIEEEMGKNISMHQKLEWKKEAKNAGLSS